MPSIAPNGLNQGEMDSAVTASNLSADFIGKGDIINLPYITLQKLSLHFFGLSLFSIKLPSIIIGAITGFFIILLLNRWFKNDVAIIGSILTTLSTAFLFLAGNGTPIIMYVFWLALILWLGSKIVGNENINPILVVSFFISIALASYTPHLLYVAFAIAAAGLLHPHLRFALKQLQIWQLIICVAIFVLFISPLVIGCIVKSENIQALLSMPNLNIGDFINNIAQAFAPFFSFSMAYDSIFLAPLFGLATVALVAIGVLASIGKMFTSRNTVVSLLVIYSIIIAGLNRDVAISIIIPLAVLSAAGVESIINKWYSLFPENPYAHLFGIIPMMTIIVMIIASGLSHFMMGYRYAPRVVDNFTNDLALISEHVDKDTPIIIPASNANYAFYQLLAKYSNYQIRQEISESDTKIAIMQSQKPEHFELKEIITSPKSRNSDRLYIYSKISEKEEKGEE